MMTALSKHALDGVTLTKAPKPLTAKQRHMAQGIKAMWILDGEQYDNAMRNYNWYGIQLGQKVHLSGADLPDMESLLSTCGHRDQK